MESWKPIPRYPGYEASTLGRIRSLKRKVKRKDGRVITVGGKVLKPVLSSNGYLQVGMYLNQLHRPELIQVLVLEAFRGPRPTVKRHFACHEDDCKTNNTLENLQWKRPKGNTADSRKNRKMCVGAAHPLAKLDDSKVARMRRLRRAGISWDALAAKFGVSQITARWAVSGKKWKHVKERPCV